MTKVTYLVNNTEVNTFAEARSIAARESDIVKRYTPIAKKPLNEKEIAMRDLRLKAYGF